VIASLHSVSSIEASAAGDITERAIVLLTAVNLVRRGRLR
jgi:hypothetical protein